MYIYKERETETSTYVYKCADVHIWTCRFGLTLHGSPSAYSARKLGEAEDHMQAAPDQPCKKVKTNTSAAAAQLSSGLRGAASALREPGTCHPEDVLTFWFGKDYQQRCGSRLPTYT